MIDFYQNIFRALNLIILFTLLMQGSSYVVIESAMRELIWAAMRHVHFLILFHEIVVISEKKN